MRMLTRRQPRAAPRPSSRHGASKAASSATILATGRRALGARHAMIVPGLSPSRSRGSPGRGRRGAYCARLAGTTRTRASRSLRPRPMRRRPRRQSRTSPRRSPWTRTRSCARRRSRLAHRRAAAALAAPWACCCSAPRPGLPRRARGSASAAPAALACWPALPCAGVLKLPCGVQAQLLDARGLKRLVLAFEKKARPRLAASCRAPGSTTRSPGHPCPAAKRTPARTQPARTPPWQPGTLGGRRSRRAPRVRPGVSSALGRWRDQRAATDPIMQMGDEGEACKGSGAWQTLRPPARRRATTWQRA